MFFLIGLSRLFLIQVPQQAPVSHPELIPFAQLSQPAVFPTPLQNGSDAGAVTTAAQPDNRNPQGQISAPCDSASSGLTQQKPLSNLTDAAGQGPAETSAEVWPLDSLLLFFFLVLILYFCLYPPRRYFQISTVSAVKCTVLPPRVILRNVKHNPR